MPATSARGGPPRNADGSRKTKIRILSLDGGGIRGVLPALFLASLEMELQRQSGDPDLRLVHCFDLLAGTSTGGILTSLLLNPDLTEPMQPRFSATEICEIFLAHLPIAFANVRDKGGQGLLAEKYDGRSLAMLMRMVFGRTKLSHLVRPCLIPAYDLRQQIATFFCSHDYYGDERRRVEGMDIEPNLKSDWLMRDVCLATAAAPVFFKPAQIHPVGTDKTDSPAEFLDGGLFANNPILCAYAEVRAKWADMPGVTDMLMVSVGTGTMPQPIQGGGYLTGWSGGIKLIELLMDAGTDAAHFSMERIYGDTLAEYYHRINWELPTEIDLDDTSEHSMETLFGAFSGGRELPEAKSWKTMGAEMAQHPSAHVKRQLKTLATQLLESGDCTARTWKTR